MRNRQEEGKTSQPVEDLSSYTSAYRPEFKFYDENQWYLGRYVDRIEAFVQQNPVTSMLSLGIGHRVVSSRLLRLLADGELDRYTVIEGSKDIIEGFRAETNTVEGLELVHSYFESFESNSRFDAIEMGFVLEHVDDPKCVLERFKPYLTEGGRLFVAVPNARSLHRLIGHHAGLLDDLYQLSEYDHQLGHKRYFDLETLIQLLENAGFEVIEKQGLMLKPVTADQMRKLEWDSNIVDALMVLGDRFPEIANCMLVEAIPK